MLKNLDFGKITIKENQGMKGVTKYRKGLMLILLFFISAKAFTENNEDIFSLSYPIDIPLIATGIGLFTVEIFLQPAEGAMQLRKDISGLDRLAIFNYNKYLDVTSDILFYSSLSLPVLLLIEADWQSIVETTVMFSEVILLSISTKNLMKNLCVRWRPYTYFDSYKDDNDYMNSFPSGHTTTVFAVCSFASYSYSKLYPQSKWKVPFFIGAYTIATATGVMRVVSGNHFITDVMTGAVIGSVIGFGVPLLHQIKTKCPIFPSFSVKMEEEPELTLSFNI